MTSPLLSQALLGRRLGTCLLALGRNFEAEKLLRTAADRFTAKLGADNPVSGEARLACAIVQARQLLPFQVSLYHSPSKCDICLSTRAKAPRGRHM